MSCDSATLHSINYVIGLYRDTLHSFIRIYTVEPPLTDALNNGHLLLNGQRQGTDRHCRYPRTFESSAQRTPISVQRTAAMLPQSQNNRELPPITDRGRDTIITIIIVYTCTNEYNSVNE